MAKHAMECIREAEIAADEAIREAHKKATKIIDDAKQNAERLSLQSERSAIASEEEALAALQSQNEHTLKAAEKEMDKQLEELAAKARERQSDAVTAVIRSIV